MSITRNDKEGKIWVSLDAALGILGEVFFEACEIVDPVEIEEYLQNRALAIRSKGRDIRIEALKKEGRI